MSKELLKHASVVIKQLRATNKLQAARLQVFDAMVAVFNNSPQRYGVGECTILPEDSIDTEVEKMEREEKESHFKNVSGTSVNIPLDDDKSFFNAIRNALPVPAGTVRRKRSYAKKPVKANVAKPATKKAGKRKYKK